MKKEKVHDNAIKNITETGALKMGEITEAKRAEVSEKKTYRTKCVDRNRLQPLNFKGWGRFNLF